MHKKTPADKKTGARNRKPRGPGGLPPNPSSPARRTVPRSVSELLTRQPKLSQLSETAARQRSWADWLCERLPEELAPHVVSVVPAAEELIVFADSAAWCARMRYALAALETQIHARDASLRRARVRVQMRQ